MRRTSTRPLPTDPDTVERRSALRTIRRVLPYLWPEGQTWVKVRVVLAMAALVLAKVATVAVPAFFGWAVDALAPKAGAESPAYLLIGSAVGLVVAYGAVRVAGVGFNQLRDAIFARVGQRALRRLALETFRHIHALSLRYHLTRKTGGLSRIIERGVKGVEFLLRFLLFSIGPLALELAMVCVIFALAFGGGYLAVVAATIVAYVAFTFRVTEWRVKVRRKMNEEDTTANQRAIDSLLNFETVKYFGAERREAERYDSAMQGYERAAVTTSLSLAGLNFGQSFIITVGLVGVMVMGALAVQDGTFTVGQFTMINAYMVQITLPLNFLGTVYREIRQALVDMGEMFDLLEVPPEVADKPGATPLQVNGGRIAFDEVKFAYDPDRPILKGISFAVEAGQTVAVVGPSGSGKSTIGRLLFRFYDVAAGRLSIDGQDVRDVTQESLRAQIGVVPQDTVLFNDSIGYNIAYGRPDATREQVEAVARSAQIHDFIQSLPQGYDTQVGERGLKLSGGEKQRVGIARTLLKNPPILLLDEATSALDSETEQGILDALRAMGQGRSVITIAHRLSTVVHADQIVVLEAGEVVERGTHDALLAAGGRYAGMWARQQSEQAEDGADTAGDDAGAAARIA
ncbi:ATP-binding cassette domain-containing protein [Rhodobacteraceae bacterium 2CG4]|uniref:ATP-binding cassette domain-containing protein n=1 Tax=Halovulum marinum TaxID=2662447 RepID=A0A6L5YY92_9RHOB|nr:ABC transporter ATP-binding protein/permease [Halovulum marinum]MSU88969.1 ATP-binding cassette domain-containing protein [Halovulum marinum]